MHSSRMRTARSSSRSGGGLYQAPPGSDPPRPAPLPPQGAKELLIVMARFNIADNDFAA